ncbi:MAG: hypothetical protein HEQ20_03315 [Aphanizomenon flos-aquae KM1D3_PB]|uniref:hypothetical protein n=1 Tax=Aphanizomenon flos-aquae TaxID=1176 RepID=UPI000A5CEABC|nr:hypothetical protein [Aphanizomenon flos-aquae]QSV69957.1 MAG: hypothetical protein HEQ20_03315 [Aphanizomenon flos-aquae KM1D3_PB]
MSVENCRYGKAKGKRQEARGKSEKGLGDFTFLYTVWFYCVHLLTVEVKAWQARSKMRI